MLKENFFLILTVMFLELDFCFKVDFCKLCFVIKSISSSRLKRLKYIYRDLFFVHICNNAILQLETEMTFDLTIKSADALVCSPSERRAGMQKTGTDVQD